MTTRFTVAAAVCALGTVAWSARAGSPAGETAAGAGTAPAAVSGFDPTALDRSVDPCQDFFQFACGGWMVRHPLPADQSRWGRFDELGERNRDVLRTILADAAKNEARRTLVERQLGDYYAACMDEGVAERLGGRPLRADLDRIAALKSKADLAEALAEIHRRGERALFRFASLQDFKDSTVNLAALDQGGLGLPDRDQYLKDDARSVELRTQYREHVHNMLRLLGDAPETARAGADTVLELETALARISMERVRRRDPDNLYHPVRRDELPRWVPSFAWERYFKSVGAPAFERVNLVSVEFFKGLETRLQAADLEAWKTYLRWHLVREAAPALSAAYADEAFNFYGRQLQGAKEQRPRWKRCVEAADDDLGEALGQLYVARTFGEDGKARTLRLVQALERALERDIRDLPWMTAATKVKALEKLAAISNKIGFPDTWRDYSSVQVRRDDFLGNRRRAQAFDTARELAKIGQPADPKEWRMTPPTVNAYYEPSNNSINFPAGILQPPFFDRGADDALNFGGIGSVIGHELTHGFDDQGRRFGADGNLKDWWTAEDSQEFERRAQCLVEQYAGYTTVDDVKLNGKLTLGENVADNGGLRLAYLALQDTLAGRKPEPLDGFSAEQRVFLGWGQVWCQNVSPEAARLRAQTDPHAPGRYRVNGTVSNMPEFQQAFACKAGSAMVRANACRVW